MKPLSDEMKATLRVCESIMDSNPVPVRKLESAIDINSFKLDLSPGEQVTVDGHYEPLSNGEYSDKHQVFKYLGDGKFEPVGKLPRPV